MTGLQIKLGRELFNESPELCGFRFSSVRCEDRWIQIWNHKGKILRRVVVMKARSRSESVRPLLRAVVEGENHDTLTIDGVGCDKGRIRNDQFPGARNPA